VTSFGVSFFPIPEFLRNFRKFYRFYVQSRTVGRVHHVDRLLRIVFGNIFSKYDGSMKEIEGKVPMASTEGGRAGLGFGAEGMLRGDRGLLVYGRGSNPVTLLGT
jgi:hypothetical protein